MAGMCHPNLFKSHNKNEEIFQKNKNILANISHFKYFLHEGNY